MGGKDALKIVSSVVLVKKSSIFFRCLIMLYAILKR